jgi:pilus assembly protein Flp/PilA
MAQSDQDDTRQAQPLSLRSTMMLMRKSLPRDEKGATAIEYAMVAAGIGVAIAATITKLGTATASFYQSLANLFQ